MRKYFFEWSEKENAIFIKPMKSNESGKVFILTKKDIITFSLADVSIGKETLSTLDGCLERLSEEMEKEDFVIFAGFLYSWGSYTGAKNIGL